MPSIDSKLDLLRRMRRPLRDAALVAGLRAASREEADAFVAEMLDCARDARSRGLLREVIARWGLLSPEARRAARAAAGDDLPEDLALLAQQPDPAARRAPVQVLADMIDGRVPTTPKLQSLALIAVAALGAEDLGDSLIVEALACVSLEVKGGGPLDAESDRTLAEAARRYEEHRSSGLMDAVLRRAVSPGAHLRAWLEDESEPGHLALRAAVRRLPNAEAAGCVVPLMGVRSIAGACVERLERLTDPALRERLLLDAPLLVARRRSQALRRIKRPERILPDRADLETMSARARLGYLRWVDALPLRPEIRLERLSVGATDPDPRVRLAAVRAMSREDASPTLDEALAQVAADADERVAVAAAGALAHARSDLRRLAIADFIGPLVDSPHEAVRAIVRGIVGAVPPGRSDARRRWADSTSVRAALLRAHEETIADLRSQILHADRSARLDAITISTRLGLGGVLREQILSAARDADPYVAAKAAGALSALERSGTGQELSRLIEHKDARVRASAIEAIGAMRSIDDADSIDITRFAEHPTPRVRANTLRAMLHDPARAMPARARLAEMLADTRPEHRRSALWVVERCGVTALADRVAEIVRFDPDEAVRVRARRCGRRLLAEMRRSWGGRSGSGTRREVGV